VSEKDRGQVDALNKAFPRLDGDVLGFLNADDVLLPGALKTIVANCMSHARRRFVDVVNDFPDEVRHLLEALKTVYEKDALARQRALSPEERLRFHQTESGPVMDDLEKRLGGDALGRGMKLYYKRWHHRHPGTADLREALR